MTIFNSSTLDLLVARAIHDRDSYASRLFSNFHPLTDCNIFNKLTDRQIHRVFFITERSPIASTK
ncbi:MAG: hypothetical protein JGK24_26660 [Microcoleus sp. PH2017_29_MFU_D_A]|uniref:hypothetical protein n=1 Tax=unclassified Microcoleus TaxID=2642155 RepID=UPI001D282C33|nr:MULTISPECIES: hypothetical protein [unclassified Microcoleus]MCC3418841.1 hypothetical protein [Microcoleus sp. PH2017_07_MST_O_A]MCC3433524.1 hypothetical protein [Microcoleus sp. PH2017_04_SCI_O_A]MCC3445498.1 hypothetical protein [Microcoleus sp. PH2017_03_ELD_O_A]MCC3470007.1 hypothetical protein [Microcoleus sp. PH2017_06_SFM_O_A]MCC3506996.1 hypothetical protein [Microcoleus sp. PH2017_19_SFW_U_A]MCC3512000.1 hypothetical protein [Microcoleus sp. PH2017_17_BER_D_A]